MNYSFATLYICCCLLLAAIAFHGPKPHLPPQINQNLLPWIIAVREETQDRCIITTALSQYSANKKVLELDHKSDTFPIQSDRIDDDKSNYDISTIVLHTSFSALYHPIVTWPTIIDSWCQQNPTTETLVLVQWDWARLFQSYQMLQSGDQPFGSICYTVQAPRILFYTIDNEDLFFKWMELNTSLRHVETILIPTPNEYRLHVFKSRCY